MGDAGSPSSYADTARHEPPPAPEAASSRTTHRRRGRVRLWRACVQSGRSLQASTHSRKCSMLLFARLRIRGASVAVLICDVSASYSSAEDLRGDVGVEPVPLFDLLGSTVHRVFHQLVIAERDGRPAGTMRARARGRVGTDAVQRLGEVLRHIAVRPPQVVASGGAPDSGSSRQLRCSLKPTPCAAPRGRRTPIPHQFRFHGPG